MRLPIPFKNGKYKKVRNSYGNLYECISFPEAGVSKDVVLKLQPFQQFEQPKEKSIIITNPPYGERISSNDLLGLYEMIGERLKHAFTGNTAWILSYRDECFDKIGLKATKRIPLLNGALDCEFRQYEIFDGKYKDFRAEGEELSKEPKDFKEHRPAAPRKDFKPRERHSFNEGERKDFKPRERKDFQPREKKEFKSDRKPRSGESYPERKRREKHQ